mmetsp:Transcript_8746/g.15886  ORF Transcript_8746/g.15886 Transcript_8746/m.15886 type:complete len:202 (+) Transcript_8746:2816-3421(+)
MILIVQFIDGSKSGDVPVECQGAIGMGLSRLLIIQIQRSLQIAQFLQFRSLSEGVLGHARQVHRIDLGAHTLKVLIIDTVIFLEASDAIADIGVFHSQLLQTTSDRRGTRASDILLNSTLTNTTGGDSSDHSSNGTCGKSSTGSHGSTNHVRKGQGGHTSEFDQLWVLDFGSQFRFGAGERGNVVIEGFRSSSCGQIEGCK